MKCSIITATYNSEQTVLDSVKSVISQTYNDIEPVIIDGASKDNTVQVIKDAYNDSSLEPLIISEPDKGIYDALNKGIAKASGDVIAFMHADDIYADEKAVEKAVKTLMAQDVDSVYGDLTYVSKEDTDKVIRYWMSGECTRKEMEKGWMPPHPSFFVRKTVYDKYGNFDTGFRIAADYDFMMRVLYKEGISTYYLPHVLVKMRVGGESNRSIKNLIKKSKEDLKAMKNNGLGGAGTLINKNIRKIPQFFKKEN